MPACVALSQLRGCLPPPPARLPWLTLCAAACVLHTLSLQVTELTTKLATADDMRRQAEVQVRMHGTHAYVQPRVLRLPACMCLALVFMPAP